jgi:hypothetical protein
VPRPDPTHQIVIHRWGWTLVLNPDSTTTAWNKDEGPAQPRTPGPGRVGPRVHRDRLPDRSVPRDGRPGWGGSGSTGGCCPERCTGLALRWDHDDSCHRLPRSALSCGLDVTDVARDAEVVDETAERLGRLDVLVNGPGSVLTAPLISPSKASRRPSARRSPASAS